MSGTGLRPPDVERRAPGRVNLIGEHTDYSLLPVLPMAIDRAVRVRAWRRTDGALRIDSVQFPDPLQVAEVDGLEALSGWHRYAWAAARLVGMPDGGADLMVESDLPSFGGLSSSSALTVALVATLRELTGQTDDPDAIVDQTVAAERMTGVAGGTMDQNVIVRARAGHALRIDFAPFATRHVAVPDGLAFVAAHSGTVAAKGAAAKAHYNSRVVGCRIAAALLSRAVGIEEGAERGDQPPALADVAAAPGVVEAVAGLPDQLSAAAASGDESPERLVVGSGLDVDTPVPVQACAAHVLSEAQRVDDAEVALTRGEGHTLGALFDASHASLQRFGASTEALDRLTTAMRGAGAHGARLTGAGFGGFAVAVCPVEAVAAVETAAARATGGPAFRVIPDEGLS